MKQLEERMFWLTKEICERERLIRVAEQADRELRKLRHELAAVSEEYTKEVGKFENLPIFR